MGVPSDAASITEASAAAQSWLALVDQRKYADSWNGAAKAFQVATTRDKWIQAVSGVRGPLGDLVSRQQASATYRTSLPAAPDGKYVVIQFNAVFANKAQAVETVTPMQQDDGAWRVSGYYIR